MEKGYIMCLSNFISSCPPPGDDQVVPLGEGHESESPFEKLCYTVMLYHAAGQSNDWSVPALESWRPRGPRSPGPQRLKEALPHRSHRGPSPGPHSCICPPSPITTVRPRVFNIQEKITVHFHTQYYALCTRIRVSEACWNENSNIR